MSGRTIIVIGAIAVFILVALGATISMYSAGQSSGVASIDETAGGWYTVNGEQNSAPQYLNVVPGQYVVGQQAPTQYPAPQTSVQYITVPTPVIIGSLDSDNSSKSSSKNSNSSANSYGYNYASGASANSGAPYPTFADYEANYYATHPATYNPYYGYGGYSSQNQYSRQIAYGYPYGQTQYQYPYPQNTGFSVPTYPTFAEYQSWYQSIYNRY